MGQMTRAAIVSEGLLAAGQTALTARANVFLKLWLRSQYDNFLWSFLNKEAPGLALAVGVQSVTVGAGSGGVADNVFRINDPIFVYSANYSTRQVCRVRNLNSSDMTLDESVMDPASNRGLPTLCKVRPTTTQGRWDLVFNTVADKAYLLKIFYKYTPDDIPTDSSGDNTVPRYPNDRTMVKAVEVETLRHMKADNYPQERDVLAAWVVDDRMKYNDIPGIADNLGLNGRVFR